MGTDEESKIACIGDIVTTQVWVEVGVENVWYVLDIHLNLLLIGVLDEEGYYSVFGDHQWLLTSKSLVAARGTKQDNLYLIQAKLENGEVDIARNLLS